VKRPLNEIEAFRAQELLLQRATEGLADPEAAELAALGADDDYSFDLAAAAIDIATLRVEPMPAGVADKILVAAGVSRATPMPAREAVVLPAGDAPVIPITRKRRVPMVIAWTAAAAGLAFGIGAFLWASRQQPPVVAEAPRPSEARARLLASATDVTTLAWTATADPAATGAQGDVVWSPSKQEGYMRFSGLAANDPKKVQYQLWIFDKHRDDKFPVDGGVFDVGPDGEVVVKISPALHVDEPVLFAVTVEQPGGVVVSKRERIVVTAAPPKPG
jgi:anti-sigma-K factor RskA